MNIEAVILFMFWCVTFLVGDTGKQELQIIFIVTHFTVDGMNNNDGNDNRI